MRLHPRELAEQGQSRLAGNLSARHEVGEDDDAGAGGGGVGRRGRHARVERLDRRRLQDVERLAFGDPPLGIDQPHFADPAAPASA